MHPAHSSSAPARRRLIVAVIAAIGLYVILPQLHEFRSSFEQLHHLIWGWVLLAIVLTGLTYMAGALTYLFLSFRALPFRQVLLVQLAAMFMNRLLPAGVGALGTNFNYLRRHQHNMAQAATVVALNNIWGFLGHALLLLVVLAATGGHGALGFNGTRYVHAFAVILAIVAVVFAAGLLINRRRFLTAIQTIRTQILSYQTHPQDLLLALGSSMGLTFCNVLSLYCCMLAVGVHLGLAPLFFVFSFGVGAGSVTPTPGGLGGFEAGLTGGFVAYHISASHALTIALLYRLISYWLALIAGAIAFVYVQRRQVLTS